MGKVDRKVECGGVAADGIEQLGVVSDLCRQLSKRVSILEERLEDYEDGSERLDELESRVDDWQDESDRLDALEVRISDVEYDIESLEPDDSENDREDDRYAVCKCCKHLFCRSCGAYVNAPAS